MIPFIHNVSYMTEEERLQQTISNNLAEFSSREEYTSEEIALFKRFQTLLFRKSYEEASQILSQLVTLR